MIEVLTDRSGFMQGSRLRNIYADSTVTRPAIQTMSYGLIPYRTSIAAAPSVVPPVIRAVWPWLDSGIRGKYE
jgi:hypothetical protein